MQPIEVFADIWCPFAHAGLRALRDRREQLARTDVPLVVRAWPLELINQEPQDPAETAAHVEDLRRAAAPDLFKGFDAERFPRTSLPALALAAAAYRHTSAVGERVSFALREALWEQGVDIGDTDAVRRIGAEHGVDAWGPEDERSIEEDWELGRARGVQGSPHFFCGDVAAFCPSLDIDSSGEGPHVHVSPDPAALDDFLRRCLS